MSQGQVKPSASWPIRVSALNGNETLLRQNAVGDASSSPKEELIPTSLILDYILANLPAGNTVFDVNTGTVDPPATGATPVSSFYKNTNSGEWFIIDSTGASFSIADDTNLARIVSGAMVSTDLVLTRDDASTITIDLSSVGGGVSVSTETLTSGNFSADVTRLGGSATTLATPSAGTFTLDIKAGSDFQRASIFGDNTTLNPSNEIVIRIDNSANAADRRVMVQLYDANNDALVDQQLTGTVHTSSVSGNVTTITIPGLNGFGASGYRIEIR
jgi:hypothetical protein